VASDGANMMIGKNNSFVSRFKSLNPNLILMLCVCHSSALIANKSCKMLPRSAEDRIRSVASYVSGSTKRCAQLMEIQKYLTAISKIFKTWRYTLVDFAPVYFLIVRMLDRLTTLFYSCCSRR
jgi:hypothetical protein